MNNGLIRLITVTAALSAACGGYASIPEYFHQEWQPGTLPEGWEAEGSGKTPSGPTAGMLGGSDSWQIVEFPYGDIYAASGSTTSEWGRVNTALTTPEIEIPESGAVLSLYVANYNPDGDVDNKISIYVVDPLTGKREEEEFFYTRVKANNYAAPAHIVVPLTALAGTTTRFAFVNEGNNAGLLGIGQVTVSMYEAAISDRTHLFSTTPDPRKVRASVTICAPCNSFTATLSAPDIEDTLTVAISPDAGYVEYPLDFTSLLSPEPGHSIAYTITVTPDMTDTASVTKRGSVTCGEGFESVVVEEEGTGARCGYCPLGAAELDLYSTRYPERFIGIGVHCTELSTEALRAPGYADHFVTDPRFPILSLPNAVINRRIMVSPTDVPEFETTIETMLEERSIARVDVERVECDFITGEVKVDFSVTMAADITGGDFKAAAVLTADGLTGESPQWIQHNYYTGQKRPGYIDDALWEYARFYYEYPSQIVSCADKPFNHVAMGIYPDFNGDASLLAESWNAYEPQTASISFTMPLQQEKNGFGVQDPHKTAIAILIIDGRNGEIVTARKVEASDYNRDLSDIDPVVINECNGETEYYSLQGIKINPHRCPSGIYICRQGDKATKIYISHQ